MKYFGVLSHGMQIMVLYEAATKSNSLKHTDTYTNWSLFMFGSMIRFQANNSLEEKVTQ